MISDSVMKLLQENAQNRANYLIYMQHLDNVFNAEHIETLYEIMRLQKENLGYMMDLLHQRHEYLKDITFTTKIYVEKYNKDNDMFEYFVFPQITPNIEDGDKMTFTKCGSWFNDEPSALEHANKLKTETNGTIIIKY